MYRRKLGKSKVKNIHRFVSLKNGATFLTESTLEFHSCYPLEYNPEVKSFEAQPEGFEYVYENKVHRYTPDHLARMINGQEPYIEVKPARIATRADFQDRFTCQREVARGLGRDLLLWTEEFIRKEPYFGNLQIIHKYRTQGPTTTEHRRVLAVASRYAKQGITIQELGYVSDMSEPYFLPLAYDLIARNQLVTDLSTSPLTKNSLVGINHDDYPKIY